MPVNQRRLTVSKGVWVSYRMREAGELCVFSKILSYRGAQSKRKKEKEKIYCNHIESILFKEVSRLLLSESPPKLRTYVISRREIGRRGLRMKSVSI